MSSKIPDSNLQKRLNTFNALVVDDSHFDRELAIAILRKMGIGHIQTAENGNVAATKIENALSARKPFDIILIDSRMPGQNGLNLLKWIREESKIQDQFVIVTTGTSDIKDVQQFIELKNVKFVIKPLSYDVLKAKILETLVVDKDDV